MKQLTITEVEKEMLAYYARRDKSLAALAQGSAIQLTPEQWKAVMEGEDEEG